MLISIVNTRGGILPGAQSNVLDLRDPKARPQPILWDPEMGKFRMDTENWSPGRYLIEIECEGYESLSQEIEWREGQKGIEPLILGKPGCRIWQMGGRKVPIDSPVETLLVAPKVETLEEGRMGEWDTQPLEKWMKPKGDEKSSEPLSRSLLRIELPTEKENQATLKTDLESAGFEVFALNISNDPQNPLTVLDRAIFCFEDSVSDAEIIELLSQYGYELVGRIRPDLFHQKIVNAQYKETLSWEMMDRIGQIQANPGVKWISLSHIVNAKDTAHTSGDELFALQWSLHLANVPDAWSLLYGKEATEAYGSADVIVDVFDSGIQSNIGVIVPFSRAIHPDFNVNVQGGSLEGIDGNQIANTHKIYHLYDFSRKTPSLLMSPNNDRPKSAHGVEVAGIVGAASSPDPSLPLAGVPGNDGIAGVSPNVRLMGSQWGSNMPDANWYDAWGFLAGFNGGWNGTYAGTQIFPPDFNTPQNLGPGFSISNHSHSWASVPNFAPGNTEADLIDCFVSFGRNRRGAFMVFASGNDDENISAHTRIAQHEKMIICAGSSIGPLGFEERTSYANFGAVVPPAGFNGPQEFAEIDICAPTNHHAAWGNGLDNSWHYFHQPMTNFGVFTTGLVGRPGVADAVGVGGVPVGSTTLTVVNGALFRVGDPILIGNDGGTREDAVVFSIAGNVLTLMGPLSNAFAGGQQVLVDSLANSPYNNGAADTLNGGVLAGGMTITLNNIAGFVVGSAVRIGNMPVYPANNTCETGFIESILGTTITLRDPLRFGHGPGEAVICGAANISDSFSGTSAAAPFASGVYALVVSANPKLSFWEARDLIKRNAEKVDLRLQSPNPGVLNVQWVDLAGNAIVDGNGLLQQQVAPQSVVSSQHFTDPHRTQVELSSVAGLSVGQSVLFGAESTVVAFPAANQIQMVNVNGFYVGQQVEVNAGPTSSVVYRPFIGHNRVVVGNVNGFRVGHQIQISDGLNTEVRTISSIVNGSGAVPVSAMTETLFLQFSPANLINSNMTLAAPIGSGTVKVANGGLFIVGQKIVLKKAGVAKEQKIITAIAVNVLTLNTVTTVAYGIGDIVETGGLEFNYSITAQITLANRVTLTITNVNPGTNTITLNAAINPALYPLGGGNPAVVIRSINAELAVIKDIEAASNKITTKRLVNLPAANSFTIGGRSPHYSYALGSGRVDAYASVKEALNFNHDMRDLMIRNFMADDGKAATDPAENPIDSPDIWAINQAPLTTLLPPFTVILAHGAANTPAAAADSGAPLHQKPRRSSANVDMYMRIFNRGSQNSFDYSAHVYLGLKDEDIDQPILVDDYIDGPTTITPYSYIPFSTVDSLSAGATFNLNNSGPGVHPGSKLLTNCNSSPAAYGGSGTFLPSIAGGNGLMYVANLAKADRPRLPYGYTVVRTTSANAIGNTVLNLEHTRGLSNGQQILIGRPSDPGYELATINADPTISSVTLAAGLANAQPQGTLIIRLENVNTQLNGAHAAGGAGAKYSTLTVDSAAGFKLGNYVVTGNLPDAANNKFHRIVRVIRDTATGAEKLIVEPKLPAALADNTLITQVGGRLGTFVLGEVTPHDGILDGNTPADNNNISYKRVNFEHDVLFRESDGTTSLRTEIQVASDGTTLTTPFRVYVQDLDQFNTEKVVMTLTRKMVNGDYQSETYYYKTTAPIGWTLTPNTAGWLTMNAPLITASGLAATGNQTDIYFAGTLDANNTVESLSVTVNVEGNDPHPLGAQDFITTRTHTAQIFQVANLPDPNDPGLQDATGMPALVGTQTMHVFADMADLEQSQAQAFGPVDTTKFRLTSSFDTTSNPLAVVNAYAAVDGIVFLQRNLTDNTINLVLKPIKQAEIGFNKVKYFIYRGLREDDIINMGAPLEMKVNGTAYPAANFVDYVNQTNDALNPGVPVPLTALGWDPLNQAPEDLVDDFFFNSSAVRQLPVVKRGMVLARFNNPLIGFEIVLAEGSYPLTLANIRLASYTLDVSGIANVDDRAAKREEILNYIDPAAYYGMHYLSGLLRAILPDPDPATIDTEKRDKTDLYNDFVSKFWTKNALYLDIRNDNGYSYNYYGNYTQQTGSDLGKAIKLGYIPPAQAALTTSKFETQEWPIIIYNNETSPENNPENMSAVYFQLSTADNGDPIAFFEYGNAVSSTTDNNYATSADLLETLVVTNINGGTNTITVAGDTSALSVGSLFYLIDCDHGPANSPYRIAAMAPNGGDTDLTVEAGTFDYNAGSGPALGLVHFQNWSKVVIVSHPNEPTLADPNKKVNVASMVKLRYFRQMHESGKPVIAIDQANKRITVAGLVPRQLKEGDKLVWSDATGTANNGTYTIAANGVLQIGNDTRVEVLEAIPDAFVGGGVDGKLKVKPTKVPAIGHYTDHKFGSLNSMMRRFKIDSLVVNSAVQSTITILGDYRHILDRNTHLSIVDASTPSNNGNYAIASPSVLNGGGNTEVVVTTSSALSASILPDPDKDLISVLALPWRSDQPTQWIAGLDLRYLDVRKQLTDAAGTVKAGFAYMGQTGVAVEQDRMIFHMTPLNFFSVPQDAYTPNVVNMNGGTSTEESFWAVMQQQNQALVLNATMLRIMPGPVILPVFDFVDDATDAIADDIEKSNFLSLCITRAEFERLKEAADAHLNGLHDLSLVLRKQQDLTDANGVAYKSFELAVSGYTRKTDGSLVAHEAFPTSAVQVFSLREDAVVFTSKDFADVENTEVKRANFEEGLRMGTDALNVYALNPSLQAHINTFNSDLIALDHDFPAIQALVQSRAEALWNLAITTADAGGSNPYDDRALYWARLHGRNAIREHATLKMQFGRRKQLMKLWDDWSRGYHSVDFSGAPVGAKKILVTGFDPFFLDTNPIQSNPAGAIALYLHGKTLVNGGTQAYIQTMVFPVRYGDFDAGKIEEMISPYVSGANQVDAIFTCSQDIVTYFNADRFAARARTQETRDNENRTGVSPKYRQYRASDGKFVKTGARNLPNFIQTSLPVALMDDTLGNDRLMGSSTQILVYKQAWEGKLSGSDVMNIFVWDPDDDVNYNPANVEPVPAVNVVPKSGSGGSYLSNEIFYRVALMRTTLPAAVSFTGHLHVPILQWSKADAFSVTATTALVQNARTIITDAIPGL